MNIRLIQAFFEYFCVFRRQYPLEQIPKIRFVQLVVKADLRVIRNTSGPCDILSQRYQG